MQYLDYDKTKIKWEGESPINKTFLIAPLGENSSVMIFNAKGQLLLKQPTSGYPAHFLQLADLTGYSYFAGKGYIGPKSDNIKGYAANGRYTIGKLYLTNNKLETIKVVDYIPTKKIPKVVGLHFHGNYVLNENHYLLQAVSLENVYINNKESYVVNCILQEQLNGEVIWEWQSIDYPELFEASFARNDYFCDQVINKEYACDYAHMNSVIWTKDKKYLYISFKHIGIIKIKYSTKKIEWILGLKTLKNWNYTEPLDLFAHQHDLHLIDNNTLYFWDNKHFCYTELSIVDNNTIAYYKTLHYPANCKLAVMGNALKVTDNIIDICYGRCSLTKNEDYLQPIISEYEIDSGKKLLDITIADQTAELVNVIYQINRGVNIYETETTI